MEQPIIVQHETNLASACWLATGLVAGAALMYFFDPEQGRRRRALARDQAMSARTRIADTATSTARDLKNRAYGLYAETRNRVGKPLESAGSEPDFTRPAG